MLKYYIIIAALFMGSLGINAQTTVKIAFEQPELFQVSPKSILVKLQGNTLLELGSELSVSGGSSPYFYLWKTGDQELSEFPMLQVNTSGIYILEVSDQNHCVCTAQYNVSEGSSIGFVEDDLLNMYPNPTNGIVYLISSRIETMRNLSIISANGEVYPYEKKSTNNLLPYEVDLQHLPDGMYYITVQFDNCIITKPIMLKK